MNPELIDVLPLVFAALTVIIAVFLLNRKR